MQFLLSYELPCLRCHCRRKVLAGGEASLPPLLAIVTDAGHASREQGNFIIKEAVSTSMSFWGAPFRYGWVFAGLTLSADKCISLPICTAQRRAVADGRV